jgi:diketogulonate reductase-like aldo/keto reductase
MKTLTMRNGLTLPALGTGTNTYGKKDRAFMGEITYDTTELASALALGYRLIDTAIYYRNEAVIGKAVKESKIDREAIFITSKIPQEPAYSGDDDLVRQSVDASLKAIDCGYIDLYLIHFPLATDEENVRVWKVLETYVDRGLIRSIGVSNFNEAQLTYLMKHARIQPVLNQFLSYPGNHNQDLIDFCKNHDIIPQAYQSLVKVDAPTKEALIELAKPYQKTWSQIILNYQVNEGMSVIPKSHSAQHQKENCEIFDFVLSEKDRIFIKNL